MTNTNREARGELIETYSAVDDQLDLLAIWNTAWSEKWVVIGITTMFGVLAVIISLALPNIYKSEVLLAPASGEQKGLVSSVAGKLGGVASLAGISLDSGLSVDPTILAIEVLKSRAFLTKFIRKHDLEVPLIAATGWDMEGQEWIVDSNIYDVRSGKWIRDVSPPLKVKPSDGELYEAFRDVLSVAQDHKTNLIRVGVKLKSPEAAKQWVNWLIDDINNNLREQEIGDARKSIGYLKEQLSKTAVAEMQNIFYQLIEQQTKRMMLAEVQEEFVFKIVDPAVVPERKSEPKRAQICILATLLGGIMGLIFVFVRKAVAERRIVEFGEHENKSAGSGRALAGGISSST